MEVSILLHPPADLPQDRILVLVKGQVAPRSSLEVATKIKIVPYWNSNIGGYIRA
jgi:hypothetical protein